MKKLAAILMILALASTAMADWTAVDLGAKWMANDLSDGGYISAADYSGSLGQGTVDASYMYNPNTSSWTTYTASMGSFGPFGMGVDDGVVAGYGQDGTSQIWGSQPSGSTIAGRIRDINGTLAVGAGDYNLLSGAAIYEWSGTSWDAKPVEASGYWGSATRVNDNGFVVGFDSNMAAAWSWDGSQYAKTSLTTATQSSAWGVNNLANPTIVGSESIGQNAMIWNWNGSSYIEQAVTSTLQTGEHVLLDVNDAGLAVGYIDSRALNVEYHSAGDQNGGNAWVTGGSAGMAVMYDINTNTWTNLNTLITGQLSGLTLTSAVGITSDGSKILANAWDGTQNKVVLLSNSVTAVIPGDVDGNGTVELADSTALNTLIKTSGAYNEAGDLNNDGFNTNADLHQLNGSTSYLGYWEGDFNMSQAVDSSDLTIYKQKFGSFGSTVTWYDGDANASGTVDSSDLTIYKQNFGKYGTKPVADEVAADDVAGNAVPNITYDPSTGALTVNGDGLGDLYAFKIFTDELPLAAYPENLPAFMDMAAFNWKFAQFPGYMNFVDDSSYSAIAGTDTNDYLIALLPTGLTAADFAGAQYAFGVGAAATEMMTNVTVVPEPATMSLLGLGAVALLRRKRS